jgi:SAM-dependent methyltransferase
MSTVPAETRESAGESARGLKHLTNEWPAHAAPSNTHARVWELVQARIGELAGKRVLDVPCGAGAFSARLAASGADLRALDVAAVEPFLAPREARALADANLGLPFAAGEFDAVVTIEGIEHLENPSLFLRECARVTRPGGWIFLTTPNVDSLRSRKYVAAYGFHRYFGPVNDTDKDSGHLHPIDMIFMRGALRRAGLEIAEVTVNRVHKKRWWTEWLRPRLTRKLPAYMKGEVPFYGDSIIYVLRKP